MRSDALPAVPVLEILERLGLVQRRGRWGPCPSCQVDRQPDGRGPIRPDGRTFWCNACGVKGDAYDLVALHLCGRMGGAAGRDFPRVRAWIEGVDALESRGTAEPERQPPPRDEVIALFRNARRAHEDPEVADYLRSRGIRRPDLCPAWALPRDFRANWWPAAWSRVWRLVVPAWGPQGQVRTLHARAIVPTEEGKSRWPLGCVSGATVFADAPGRRLLRGNVEGINCVIVCEGLTDFAKVSARATESGMLDAAVLGIENGSEPALRLIRIPDATRVCVAVDPDRDGNKYADAIAVALAPVPCWRIPLHLIERRG